MLGADRLLSASSPLISAISSGGNLTLSWPVTSADFTVMTTTNLVGGNWTPAVVTAQIIGGQWQVVLPVGSGAQFYELQK